MRCVSGPVRHEEGEKKGGTGKRGGGGERFEGERRRRMGDQSAIESPYFNAADGDVEGK